MKRMMLLFALCLLGTTTAFANDIAVSNVSLSAVSSGGGGAYRNVQFSLSWQNSWRNDVAGAGQQPPKNYDAAWVFVKFRRQNDPDWRHVKLSLSASDHSVPSSAALTLGDSVGAFVYRAANGSGAVNFQNIQLRWNMAANGLTTADTIVAIRVFAVEMVYVPQDAYFLGDAAGSNGPCGSFYSPSNGGGPLYVSTEASITVGSASQLYYNSCSYAGDRSGPIPDQFPKGFKAFYCMKYEISQGQWVDFLNSIILSSPNHYANSLNSYRHRITIQNGKYSTDRPDRACNYISWYDALAYADWTGLRPMTELEYEKACRGPIFPQMNEYAWGTTATPTVTTIIGNEDGTETVMASTGANYNAMRGTARPSNSPGVDYTLMTGGDGSYGPLRVGIFATTGTTRLQAGATYYGIMEMTGNLSEQCVGVGQGQGRAFFSSSLHGNGELSNGSTDMASWSSHPYSISLRGGNWATTNSPVQSDWCGGGLDYWNGGYPAGGSGNVFFPQSSSLYISGRPYGYMTTSYNCNWAQGFDWQTRVPSIGFRAVRSAQ